jgi:hypothetical protein
MKVIALVGLSIHMQVVDIVRLWSAASQKRRDLGMARATERVAEVGIDG